MTLTTDLLQLTRKQNPTGGDVLHLKDPITKKDHFVLLSDILTGQSYDSWEPATEYSELDRVTFGFKLFESLQDNNTGNIPNGGITDVWWKEVSESSKPDSLERTISKAAHGFVVGNVLTLDNTGSFVKVSTPATDVRIAMVSEVIDSDNFKCVLGGYVTGLTGLVSGSKYYGQSDGTIGTAVTDMLVLIADSSVSGYLISSGGTSSLYGNFVGLHDASAGIPIAGTGPVGSIKKGDYWLISVAGTIVGIDGDDTLSQYDTLHAKQDNASIPGHFYGLQGNVHQATESNVGIASLENQSGAEDAATNATVGSIDHTKIITGRSLRWFWEKIKTLAITFSSSLKAKQIAGDYGVLTDAATINWDANTIGNSALVTLGGNRTISAITNPMTGAVYILRVVQDGTGNRTLTFNAAYTFPNGISPILNLAASAVTVYQFLYDGANFRYIGNNGALRVTDLLVNNQIQSGKKVGLYIDSDGTLKKLAEGEYNSTNKSWTFTGVDNSSTTVFYEWVNLGLSRILALYNDQHIEVGGSTSYIKVGSSVASGDAKLEFLDNKALAYILGTSGQNFIEFVSSTGLQKIRLKVDIEHDSNGSTYIQVHYETVTGTTASAVTKIGSFPLASGKMATIWSSWNVSESGGITGGGIVEHTLKNLAGTTSEIGAVNAPTPRRSSGDFTFDINADDTNDSINFDFTNSTAPNNKAYKVNIHAEIHLTNLAS